jgi:hypothetical protein
MLTLIADPQLRDSRYPQGEEPCGPNETQHLARPCLLSAPVHLRAASPRAARGANAVSWHRTLAQVEGVCTRCSVRVATDNEMCRACHALSKERR